MQKRTFDYFLREKAVPCPVGDRIVKQHKVVTEGNNLRRVETGELDIVEHIQSYEDGVSLSKMIERFKRGDPTALNRATPFYGDVSGYDDNPASVIETTRGAVSAAMDQQQQPATEPPAEPVEPVTEPPAEPVEPKGGQ